MSCAAHRDALSRGQAYYEDNQYERALAVFRELERDEASLPPPERSRYAYLRGMTDYRLGFMDHARHWLALAKAAEQYHPGGLDPAFQKRLDDALLDLSREIDGAQPSSSDAVQSIEAQTIEAPSNYAPSEVAPSEGQRPAQPGPVLPPVIAPIAPPPAVPPPQR